MYYNFMKESGTSFHDTAIEFKMNNLSLIADWNKAFLKEGIEGLKAKPKGRPPMSGKRKIETSETRKNNVP